MVILEAGFDDATVVLALPELCRRRLRTSNGMERLNDEARRRERVSRIFPNRESTIRLLGAALMERHEQWTTGHRYFDMAAYWRWRQAGEAAPIPGRSRCRRRKGNAQTVSRNGPFPADPGRDPESEWASLCHHLSGAMR